MQGSSPRTYEVWYRCSAVWLVSDGCATGVAAAVIQGTHWNKGVVCAFFSAKLGSAQQNYPVHEIEMLAGVECMLRHRDILQGFHFTWITDHKGLTHLYEQKNLSGRQARWMEKLGEFDFEIQYVPGTENVLADALSRLWSNESPGTVRGRGAYTYHDVVNSDSLNTHGISMPVLVGMEASCLANDDGLEVCQMELRGTRRPSARARGLDNDIVPGRLNMRKRSVTRGQRKEGGKGITTAPALNTGNRSEKSAMPTLNTGSESVETSV